MLGSARLSPPGHTLVHPAEFGWYGAGSAGGLVGVLYTQVLYAGLRTALTACTCPHRQPAVGGILVSLIALAFPGDGQWL